MLYRYVDVIVYRWVSDAAPRLVVGGRDISVRSWRDDGGADATSNDALWTPDEFVDVGTRLCRGRGVTLGARRPWILASVIHDGRRLVSVVGLWAAVRRAGLVIHTNFTRRFPVRRTSRSLYGPAVLQAVAQRSKTVSPDERSRHFIPSDNKGQNWRHRLGYIYTTEPKPSAKRPLFTQRRRQRGHGACPTKIGLTWAGLWPGFFVMYRSLCVPQKNSLCPPPTF